LYKGTKKDLAKNNTQTSPLVPLTDCMWFMKLLRFLLMFSCTRIKYRQSRCVILSPFSSRKIWCYYTPNSSPCSSELFYYKSNE